MGETGERHGFLSGVIEMVITVAVAIAVALLLRTFVFEVYEVPTGSMLETIQEGDRLVGEKITYRYSEPKQGDIVTFSNPDGSDTTLIKRVIAVGGQTIDLRDGVVYVDGVAYGPDNEPPADVAEQITNPKAWGEEPEAESKKAASKK